MNKLSKRVLSLLLALLMVLGTCDQALAAGLDNGRYASDEVTEVVTDAPKDNAGAGAARTHQRKAPQRRMIKHPPRRSLPKLRRQTTEMSRAPTMKSPSRARAATPPS